MLKRMRLILCLTFAAAFVLWADATQAQRMLRDTQEPLEDEPGRPLGRRRRVKSAVVEVRGRGKHPAGEPARGEKAEGKERPATDAGPEKRGGRRRGRA